MKVPIISNISWLQEKVSDDSKAKDKKQGIELKLRLIQTAMDNKQNAENIDKVLNPISLNSERNIYHYIIKATRRS